MTQWLEFTPEFRLIIALVPPPSPPNLHSIPPSICRSRPCAAVHISSDTCNHVLQISSPLTMLVALYGM